MLKKVLLIKNIGLFESASCAEEFAQTTLIYAENGRGKTTFTSILRSCTLKDDKGLLARQTIDIASPPSINLLLNNGQHVEFKSGKWQQSIPYISTFDSEFIEKNVYSGQEVRSDQRQSLLEFALGDTTVSLKQQIDQFAKDIATQTEKRGLAERDLSVFASPFKVNDFIAIKPPSDIKEQIDTLHKKLEATKNSKELIDRKNPELIKNIALDIPGIINLLATQIQDLEESAETIFQAHLSKHKANSIESWISQGIAFDRTDECPFCGQNLSGLQLIKAYESHFSIAYTELKSKITNIEGLLHQILSEERASLLISEIETNTARIEAWKDQLAITPPTIDKEKIKTNIKLLQEKLAVLIKAKQHAPLEKVGTELEIRFINELFSSINQSIDEYNIELGKVGTIISDYKTTIATEDLGKLKIDITKLEAILRRKGQEVEDKIKEYSEAEIERKRLDTEKSKARQALDLLMQTTLHRYQESINGLLKSFGAGFAIEKLQTTYQGNGEPRSEYLLSIRNHAVKLGSRGDQSLTHCFATTLSEGDKRTLAFAFYIAKLTAEPTLNNTIVVIDDPISSLDINRRRQTISTLRDIANSCKQLIVLSHDAYFIREMSEKLSGKNPSVSPSILQVVRESNNSSNIQKCTIEKVCASPYYTHYQNIAEFVAGNRSSEIREVAKSIRPLLEGYLHRKFPNLIPERLMFGQIIELIKQSKPTQPLSHLQGYIKEMSEINDYASQFHHDTNPSYETVAVTDAELLTFAKRTLELIYN